MADREVVLITGGSGYLGGAIIRKLAGKYQLVGLDRPDGPKPPEPAEAIDFDLGSYESVRGSRERDLRLRR